MKVVATLVALWMTKVVTTLGAPKVQIWNMQNQVNLSGKRTLLRSNSGKFVSAVAMVNNDTDGVKLVRLMVK